MSERSVVEHALTVYYDGNARTARAALAQHDQAEKAALLAEVGRLRAERDEFADRVDTLTSMAKCSKAHLRQAQDRITEVMKQRDAALANFVAEEKRLESGIYRALHALMSGDRMEEARILHQLVAGEEGQS